MSTRIAKIETILLKALPSSISFPSSLLEPDQLPVITDPATETAIKRAAALLRKGELVAFPSETVYGLGANALDEKAVSKIYQAKGRPSDNPLIVHVSSLAMLHSLLPPSRLPLSNTFAHLTTTHWPGALTLLFPTSALLPSITTASLPTVAIRLPSHPVARALIHYAGVPLAAPSANASGRPSPTKAEHVLRDLDGRVGLILDGGPCSIGLESTVLDCGGFEDEGVDWKVLRPGGVTVETLEESVRQLSPLTTTAGPRPRVLVWKKDYEDPEQEVAPRTPGMKYKHYTPGIPVYMFTPLSGKKEGVPRAEEAIDALSTPPPSSSTEPIATRKIGLMHYTSSPLSSSLASSTLDIQTYSLGPIDTPEVAARGLFDGLLKLEAEGCTVIFVEEGSENGVGRAVGERLGKAVGGKEGVVVWV